MRVDEYIGTSFHIRLQFINEHLYREVLGFNWLTQYRTTSEILINFISKEVSLLC